MELDEEGRLPWGICLAIWVGGGAVLVLLGWGVVKLIRWVL